MKGIFLLHLLNKSAEAVAAFLIIFEHIHTGAGGRKQYTISRLRHFYSTGKGFFKIHSALNTGEQISKNGFYFGRAFSVKNSSAQPGKNLRQGRKIHPLIQTAEHNDAFAVNGTHCRQNRRRIGRFGVIDKKNIIFIACNFDPVPSGTEFFDRRFKGTVKKFFNRQNPQEQLRCRGKVFNIMRSKKCSVPSWV